MFGIDRARATMPRCAACGTASTGRSSLPVV